MRIFKAILAMILCAVANAQLTVKLTPEPMIVPTSQLANANQLGRWIVEACNDDTKVVTVPWERISMAVTMVRFIDNDDALMVLTNNQNRSVAGTIVQIGTVLGQAAAIGLSIASKSNRTWANSLAIGSAVTPALINIARGQLQNGAPLISGMKYPITLPSGACFTDHRFAVRMKSPAMAQFVIKLGPSFEVPTTVSGQFIMIPK